MSTKYDFEVGLTCQSVTMASNPTTLSIFGYPPSGTSRYETKLSKDVKKCDCFDQL